MFGFVLGVRFLYFYLRNPDYSGYIQSLIVGTGAVVMACILVAVALLAELIATNCRLVEEVLMRVRRIETELAEREPALRLEGIQSTGAKPWHNQQVQPARASAR